MTNPINLLFVFLILIACKENPNVNVTTQEISLSETSISKTSLVILGTIQDAGSPHIACKKECCVNLFKNHSIHRKVVSLGVIDPQNGKTFLFEATPDITTQLKKLKGLASIEKELPDGIFLTHAHIGHYTGLMYLGKEATNASSTPVYAMPRMKSFLESNGPWSQLVTNSNIVLHGLTDRHEIQVTSNLKVTPFTVPHRDEYSETVGFIIEGPSKRVLFIPDIDKWDTWERSIIEAISEVDYAFIDATFYDGVELNYRDISEIPHPFIIESMVLFNNLPQSEKTKIHFIHFNHTNPVLNPESEAYNTIINNGFNISKIHDLIQL